jgi:hypothetical protein
MTTTQLFLNDKPVDLSDDSPIALTFQINDLADVKSQQGNTSNQFKIPLTENNRAILGYADDITIENQSLSPQIPYTKLDARVIQNGIEILPNAIAEINQIDDDTASITVLSGNVDFFDSLGGQVADMGDSTSQWSNYGATLPWKPFDHIWDLQNVANSQTHTQQDGWIYPIVDYGCIDLYDFTQPIDVRNQRPGFFIKKAIDLLIQSTGYTAKGSLLTNPLYPLLIAQFSNGSWEHGLDYQNQPNTRGLMAETSQDVNVNHPSAESPPHGQGGIGWQIINSDPSNQFVSGQGFTSQFRMSVQITVTIPRFRFQGHVTGKTPSSVDVIVWITTPGYPDANAGQFSFDFSSGYNRISGDGGSIIGYIEISNSSFSVTTELAEGQGVYIGFGFQGSTPASFTLYSGATWVITSQNETVNYLDTVQCERILPDVSQTDFLKDTLQRFGIICQTDIYTKSITFATLDDIISNIPIAYDWTTKCIDQGKQLNYQLGSYSQVNYLEYQTDPNILPLKFGWDQLIINDQTLSPIAADLLVSIFGPSLNRPYYGGTIAQIKMADAATSATPAFTIGVQPRLLVDQKIDLRQLGNKTVIFVDGSGAQQVVNDYLSVPYFYKPDGQYNLCWGDMPSTVTGQPLPGLKNTYYTALQKILQNTKVLVRYFLLTPRDIAEINLLIPVYLQQHNAWFYINKIDSWRKGQPTKVELVRLG